MDLKLKTCSEPSTVRKNPCLKSTMEKLFASRIKTGDIKFLIDGEEIYAHRCVLAALSPKYEAQFYGAMAESDTISVADVSPAAFKEFLQFFYTDDVTLMLDNIEDVLNLAKQSLVDELVTECINFLIDLMGSDKIVWCYRLALNCDIKPLAEFCLERIGTNIQSVFKTSDFKSCDRDMLCLFMTASRLNCKETDVFDACIAWAQAKCERDGLDATNTANLRIALDDVISEINFSSMKFEEFAAIDRKWSGLLSAQESNEIFHAIALKANLEANDVVIIRSTSYVSSEKCKPIQSYLECSFSRGQRAKIDTPITGVNTSITFQCDKIIELNGLVLCNRIVDDIAVSVATSEITQTPKSTVSHSNNETVLIFDVPIIVVWCHIRIKSKAFEQPNACLYGFQTEKTTKQHGILFRFSVNDEDNLNLLTRFLFNVIDKP